MFHDGIDYGLIGEMKSPVVKSGMMDLLNLGCHVSTLNGERFSQLEHLADIIFDQVEPNGLEHLLHLKYISGYCRWSTQVY